MSDHRDQHRNDGRGNAEERTASMAAAIRGAHLHKPFGIIKVWGMGLVPPNDQSYELVSTHAEGARLDLCFVHESRSGLPGVISVWEPDGLEDAPGGVGLVISAALRVRMDDTEAQLEGDKARMKTTRGEGLLETAGVPALKLAR